MKWPMTLDEEWAELKPKVLALLEEGWNKDLSFMKVGIKPYGKLYNLCFLPDTEFRERIRDYNKKQKGFS